MSRRNLTRRLEHLEAELAPARDPEVLTIEVTRADKPGEGPVLRIELNDRKRGGGTVAIEDGPARQAAPQA